MSGFPSTPSSRLRFADFELDVRTLELWHAGVLVPLQPRPARVLVALAQAAGELVTRDELRVEVWKGGTHVDFEQSLKTCIKQIRGVLGDDARAPRFVETLPRRGYRFVATVEAPEETAQPVPANRSTAARLRRPLATEIGLLSIVVLLLLALLRSGLASDTVTRAQRELAAMDSTGSREGLNGERSPAHAKWLEALSLIASADATATATGIDLLREAEALDPTYAPVQVALARAYIHLPLEAAERLPAARRAIDRALAIDSSLAEAFEIRGYLRFHYERDWSGARADLETSIRLDPVATGPLRILAYWHAAAGQPSKADELIRRAITLEPDAAAIHTDAGWLHYYGRRYDEALHACGTALKLNARAEGATYCILLSALALGDTGTAARQARERLAASGATADVLRRFDAAPPEQALRMFWGMELEALNEGARYGATSAFRRLLALVMLGRQDDVLDVLQADLGDCDPPVLPFLGVAPYFDSLRSSAAFRELVDTHRLVGREPLR